MTQAGLRKLTRSFLLLVTLSTVYLEYWEYRRTSYQDPDVFNKLLRGQGNAPQQYRIGVLQVANLLHRILHLNLRHGISLIDLVSAGCAVFLLLACLERMAVYDAASLPGKGVACAAYVCLVQFYFTWAIWFQRPETFTTALSVALLLWLLTPGSRPRPLLLLSSSSWRRLPSPFCRRSCVPMWSSLLAGVLLVCLLNRADGAALPRWLQAGTSLAAVLAAGGTQFYIMHVVYPHATYGDVQMFQLKLNLHNPSGMIPFCLFMAPYVYLLRHWTSRRLMLDLPSTYLFPGSFLVLVLWCVFGRVDEVRIMLPYTLALAPLLATLLMQQVVAIPPRAAGIVA